MENLWSRIEPLLLSVERPSRYIDHEWGANVEPAGADDLTFCMVYPDTYELGQANQAVRILVNAVNATEGLHASRAYLPAVDMIERMREEGIPLFSLEEMAPLDAFDVVGITLPHELAATNVLEVLDLANIPLRAAERTENDPLVIAGGPCAYNPEPYAAFFDVISIGEGEELTPETLLAIRELKRKGASRTETLRALAQIEGTYVPSLYEPVPGDEIAEAGVCVRPLDEAAPRVVHKRIFEGFSESSAWEPMVVPYVEVVHDRLNVEVLRGCARGCRFCQAGMMYRPVRERSTDNIVGAVSQGLAETGYEEVSLTSLSTTDHSCISEILSRLNCALVDTGVRVSIPSQRLDSFGVEMAGLVAGQKKGGLTFAPEAGTQRMRDAINKNVTEDDLLSAVEAACAAGWRRIKLYFRIGLPGETDADASGIGQLAQAAFDRMRAATPKEERGSLSLNVSIALFVPKAQTPFQWDGQIPKEEALRRVSLAKSALKSRAVRISYHEPKTSFVEAVMSRGGREVADLVESAWRHGARFDAWSELFLEEAWSKAAEECGLDMRAIAETTFAPGTVMPWNHISACVSPQFLERERRRADEGITTPDCTMENCAACGVCPTLGVDNQLEGRRS